MVIIVVALDMSITHCVHCVAGMGLWYMGMVQSQMWHAKGLMACAWVTGR